jgi:hypothetical protein
VSGNKEKKTGESADEDHPYLLASVRVVNHIFVTGFLEEGRPCQGIFSKLCQIRPAGGQ